MMRPMIGSAIGTASADYGGARQDTEAHEAVNAGVIAVGYKRRAAQPLASTSPNLRGDLVAHEPDDARRRVSPQAAASSSAAEADAGSSARAQRPLFTKIAAGSGRPALPTARLGALRNPMQPEWDCRERVTEVVDEIGEERHAEHERRRSRSAPAAVTVSTTRLSDTALIPARERRIERSTRPWEWPCPCSWAWSGSWS